MPSATLLPIDEAVSPNREVVREGTASKIAAVALFLLLAGVYLWVGLGVRPPRGFSGDEPHYLAITQGLWLYHTIDQHRVLYHHDFFAYYPRLMSSHSVHRGERLYPLHYLGFPAFLLPGFAIGGARGAQMMTALVAVLVCWRAWRLCRRVAGPIAALVTVGVLGLSAPFVLNAGAIYPDLLSALLLLLVFEAVDVPRLSARRALALGLLLAYAPWLHVKLLVIAAIAMAWATITLWRQRQDRGRPATAVAWQHAGTAVPGVGAMVAPSWRSHRLCCL